ncbi:FAS1 domain-containing protein [Xylaria digitata]|nr:FAS1 domain-containing protein [Xylaria digitata]
MRYTNLLPLAAALATAVVIPDEATAQELGLEVANTEKAPTPWWDALRSVPETAFDFTTKKGHGFLDRVETLLETSYDADDVFGIPRVRPSHGPSNLTIYQAIQTANFTKKFAALINDFPDIVDLLNSTETNVTVFVPIDKAFEKIPEHGHKPPKEFIEKILEYHVVPGLYPAGRLLASHTLPTSLKNPALSGRPQRLRVRLSLLGLKINFFNKVIGADFFAKNGIAHAVDSILLPPPPAGRLISLFPSKFSTLELAAAKTGLLPPPHKHHGKDGDDDEHKHRPHHNTTGLTIFAPTNDAFARLGPAANAFLFNTPRGLGFLRALLKYHIVANQTLYSDAYYGLEGRSEDILPASTPSEKRGEQNGHFHIDLPTLLGDKSLSIDIARFFGFINININGRAKVAIEDGLAFDGVVQVVGSVLFPPRKVKPDTEWSDGGISVEELIEILGPYVEEEGQDGEGKKTDQVWGEL